MNVSLHLRNQVELSAITKGNLKETKTKQSPKPKSPTKTFCCTNRSKSKHSKGCMRNLFFWIFEFLLNSNSVNISMSEKDYRVQGSSEVVNCLVTNFDSYWYMNLSNDLKSLTCEGGIQPHECIFIIFTVLVCHLVLTTAYWERSYWF